MSGKSRSSALDSIAVESKRLQLCHEDRLQCRRRRGHQSEVMLDAVGGIRGSSIKNNKLIRPNLAKLSKACLPPSAICRAIFIRISHAQTRGLRFYDATTEPKKPRSLTSRSLLFAPTSLPIYGW